MITPRTFTNRPGVTFDAAKTQILFAEDINETNANIDELADKSLKITYTGVPQTNLILPIINDSIAIGPIAAVGGQATYLALSGPSIFSFSFSETNALLGNVLLTLSFDDLVGVLQSFTPSTMASLTTLSLPSLVSIGGTFGPSTMASLTTLSLPSLVSVGGNFTPSTMASLTTLSLPSLVSIGASFTPSTMANLLTFSFPGLVSVGASFIPSTMASLTTLSLPSLVSIGGNFTPSTMASLTSFSFASLKYINGTFAPSTMASLTSLAINSLEKVTGAFSVATMAALTTVSFAGMVGYGSTITINSGLGNITYIVLGTIGTLKYITGATINCSGQKLTSASVNEILALLVSLDGTNGTTLWGAGKTLTINSGANGAPTGQGIVDKATLIARTATVTTN